MKKILMLATGGTIASRPGPDGLVPLLTGSRMTELVPELAALCEITCLEVFSLDSSNIQPHHWQELSAAIAENYDKYDGFVITHGTDTMAYTASALSLMLEKLSKPVVITGSQLPAEAPGSDAVKNILNAFYAAESGVPGVHLVFGNRIISGFCASKMHTKDFNAFYSINEPCEAVISEDKIEWDEFPSVQAGSFTLKNGIEEKVALVKIIPGMNPEIIEWYREKGYRGIVIEGFGAGGVPNCENSLLPVLEKAIKQGMVIVCATQCPFDGTDLKTYPIGIFAERAGALPAGKMTVERAVTKLMWALGNSQSPEEAKKLFSEE